MHAPADASPWRLYTVEEAAVILRRSRATVYRLVKGPNPIPHRNIRGLGIMFTAGDIDKILDQSAEGKR